MLIIHRKVTREFYSTNRVYLDSINIAKDLATKANERNDSVVTNDISEITREIQDLRDNILKLNTKAENLANIKKIVPDLSGIAPQIDGLSARNHFDMSIDQGKIKTSKLEAILSQFPEKLKSSTLDNSSLVSCLIILFLAALLLILIFYR